MVAIMPEQLATAAQHRVIADAHHRAPLQLSIVRWRAGMPITFANLMMKCKSLSVKLVAWCVGRWSIGWLSWSAFLPESFAARWLTMDTASMYSRKRDLLPAAPFEPLPPAGLHLAVKCGM